MPTFNTSSIHDQGEVNNVGNDQLNTRDITVINQHVYHIYPVASASPSNAFAIDCPALCMEPAPRLPRTPSSTAPLISAVCSNKHPLRHPETDERPLDEGYVVLDEQDVDENPVANPSQPDAMLSAETDTPGRARKLSLGQRLWRIVGTR
ncbi:hypothetical protein HWV62_37368 [Athelia sp. TMB]|nr:hypothetical protein HWV62_37368 [Athelia sp. TMB]